MIDSTRKFQDSSESGRILKQKSNQATYCQPWSSTTSQGCMAMKPAECCFTMHPLTLSGCLWQTLIGPMQLFFCQRRLFKKTVCFSVAWREKVESQRELFPCRIRKYTLSSCQLFVQRIRYFLVLR